VIVPLQSSLGNRARPRLYKIKIKHANHCPASTPVQIPAFDPREADCWGKLRVLEVPLAVSGQKEKQEGASITRNCFPQSAGITGVSHRAGPRPTSFGWQWFGYRLSKFMLRFEPQCGRCWDVGPHRSCVVLEVESSWID
ncbi:LOW QUALITY PROTEIN: CYTH2 isoform 13, partial [Pan troglodytes]